MKDKQPVVFKDRWYEDEKCWAVLFVLFIIPGVMAWSGEIYVALSWWFGVMGGWVIKEWV